MSETGQSTSYSTVHDTNESTLPSAMSRTDEPTDPVTDPDMITLDMPDGDDPDNWLPGSSYLNNCLGACRSKAKNDDLIFTFSQKEFKDTFQKICTQLGEKIDTNRVIDIDVEAMSPIPRNLPSADSASAKSKRPINKLACLMWETMTSFSFGAKGVSRSDPNWSREGMIYLAKLRIAFSENQSRFIRTHPALETAALEIEEAIIRLCGSELKDEARKTLQVNQKAVTKEFPADFPTLDTSNRDQLTALLRPGSLVAMPVVGRLLVEDDPTVAWGLAGQTFAVYVNK